MILGVQSTLTEMNFLHNCCSDLIRYVLNAFTCDSECSDCCKIHFETTEIEVGESDSELEAEIMDCCVFRHKT